MSSTDETGVGVDGNELAIVDPHQHFWDLEHNYYPWLCDPEPIAFRYGDYEALRKSYSPADYRRDAGRNRIAATVHVQADWDPGDPVGETRWLEALRLTHGLPTACVAHAQLDQDDVAELLTEHASHALVRGIRHKPRAAQKPDQARRGLPGSMDDPRWRRGFALLERLSLSFDLQTPWWHLDAACDLARDFPRTPIILNHTGLPVDRTMEGLAGWRAAMTALARHSNAFVKISGLGQRDRAWTLEANRAVIRDTIAIFGVERCMFASNFPVDKLCGTLETIYAGFRAAVAHLPVAEQRGLFHDNALRVYRL